MRVGLDAHMVGSRETGNETYVKGLVDGFKTLSDDLDVVVYHVNAPWTGSSRSIHFQKLVSASPFVRLGLELPIRSTRKLDLLHVTYAAPLWSAAPLVVSVHDISYALHPEWFSARDLRVLATVVPRSVHKAAHVITISEASRRDIIDRYHIPEDKITVTYLGPGASAQSITPEAAATEIAGLGLDPEQPYLLAVGNLQPRKNLVRLLEAFKRLPDDRRHGVDLVVAGPSHYRAEDVFSAAAPVTSRVHFTGYVTDRQLAALYTCCIAFLFPSLYEGFGLPALEAMCHGVPIACSNTGALAEVCGDAALTFDPMSTEAISDAIDQILNDSELGRKLATAGRERAKNFSWTKTAEQTVAVYRKVLS